MPNERANSWVPVAVPVTTGELKISAVCPMLQIGQFSVVS